MQSTGQTSTQAVSFVPMHGSVMTNGMNAELTRKKPPLESVAGAAPGVAALTLSAQSFPDGRTVALHLSGKVEDGCASKLDARNRCPRSPECQRVRRRQECRPRAPGIGNENGAQHR